MTLTTGQLAEFHRTVAAFYERNEMGSIAAFHRQMADELSKPRLSASDVLWFEGGVGRCLTLTMGDKAHLCRLNGKLYYTHAGRVYKIDDMAWSCPVEAVVRGDRHD